MQDTILERSTKLKLDYEDIAKVLEESNAAFAKIRHDGFGASDSSIIMDVNPYNTLDQLIAQKISKTLTADEESVGGLTNVRKGRDLEPLIISKAEHAVGMVCIKPKNQYALKEAPMFKINFDAVRVDGESLIPYECKFVSQYGDKYYNKEYAIYREIGETVKAPNTVICESQGIVELCKARAANAGIPAYYYTQVQQQMLGLDADVGYLVALHDKNWELCIYKVYADKEVQQELLFRGIKTWNNKILPYKE